MIDPIIRSCWTVVQENLAYPLRIQTYAAHPAFNVVSIAHYEKQSFCIATVQLAEEKLKIDLRSGTTVPPLMIDLTDPSSLDQLGAWERGSVGAWERGSVGAWARGLNRKVNGSLSLEQRPSGV
jgi:hypothetical protein